MVVHIGASIYPQFLGVTGMPFARHHRPGAVCAMGLQVSHEQVMAAASRIAILTQRA